jgi:hypothetical protein
LSRRELGLPFVFAQKQAAVYERLGGSGQRLDPLKTGTQYTTTPTGNVWVVPTCSLFGTRNNYPGETRGSVLSRASAHRDRSERQRIAHDSAAAVALENVNRSLGNLAEIGLPQRGAEKPPPQNYTQKRHL